jgi:hypothetical protein
MRTWHRSEYSASRGRASHHGAQPQITLPKHCIPSGQVSPLKHCR